MSFQNPLSLKKAAQTKTLAALLPGEDAVISGYDDAISNQSRVLEMGLIAGTPVRMIKTAPWGDPVQFLVRGYHLALSRRTAQAILVK